MSVLGIKRNRPCLCLYMVGSDAFVMDEEPPLLLVY